MQKLQLFISGTRIDLFKDESVSITQTIQNIKDIKKIFTEFTKTFSIPASKVNNKIFKHYYNFDIIDGFDARNKVAASIELNNIPFKNGFVKLMYIIFANHHLLRPRIPPPHSIIHLAAAFRLHLSSLQVSAQKNFLRKILIF